MRESTPCIDSRLLGIRGRNAWTWNLWFQLHRNATLLWMLTPGRESSNHMIAPLLSSLALKSGHELTETAPLPHYALFSSLMFLATQGGCSREHSSIFYLLPLDREMVTELAASSNPHSTHKCFGDRSNVLDSALPPGAPNIGGPIPSLIPIFHVTARIIITLPTRHHKTKRPQMIGVRMKSPRTTVAPSDRLWT